MEYLAAPRLARSMPEPRNCCRIGCRHASFAGRSLRLLEEPIDVSKARSAT